MITPHIRWMIRKDLTAVLEIENAVFEYPWSLAQFNYCLSQRNSIGMVAELDGEIVGYMVYEIHKNRLHVLDFAVAPEYRRHGIGRAMVAKLRSKLFAARKRIMLEVREGNLAAQLFFKSQGFMALSILKEFYDDCDEDAYVFAYRYVPSAEEVLEMRSSGVAR